MKKEFDEFKYLSIKFDYKDLENCNEMKKSNQLAIRYSNLTEPLLYTIKTLSSPILQSLSASDVIYAEWSSPMAMGMGGHVWLYIIENKELILYETFIYPDEEVYLEGIKFLSDNVDLFNYCYGGFLNHVFINKAVFLDVDTVGNFFIYKTDDGEYRLDSSVYGVFRNICEVADIYAKLKKDIATMIGENK